MDLSTLTPLFVGDRVTICVLPDDTGGDEDGMVLNGRVSYVEVHPGQVGVPWGEVFPGAPPTLLLSWENWCEGFCCDDNVQTLTVWIGCERMWIVPTDEDDDASGRPDA